MDEKAIQEKLRQNVEQATVPVTAVPDEQITNTGQARITPEYELDEMTQFKLHDLFGQQYRPNDEVNRQQLSYIFDEVSKLTETREYGFVAAKINDLQRIIGITNSDDRIYKLYQWLKLNNIRLNTEAEMTSIGNA